MENSAWRAAERRESLVNNFPSFFMWRGTCRNHVTCQVVDNVKACDSHMCTMTSMLQLCGLFCWRDMTLDNAPKKKALKCKFSTSIFHALVVSLVWAASRRAVKDQKPSTHPHNYKITSLACRQKFNDFIRAAERRKKAEISVHKLWQGICILIREKSERKSSPHASLGLPVAMESSRNPWNVPTGKVEITNFSVIEALFSFPFRFLFAIEDWIDTKWRCISESISSPPHPLPGFFFDEIKFPRSCFCCF